MESSHSFVWKDDDISAVVFSVKETKEVLEDQVENIDAGDVKIKPEGLNLLARISFNFLNITVTGIYLPRLPLNVFLQINCNQPSQGYVCHYMSNKVMFIRECIMTLVTFFSFL